MAYAKTADRKAYHKRWYQKNRKRLLALHHVYYAKHRAEYAERQRKRLPIIAGRNRARYRAIRSELLKRYSGGVVRCARCGEHQSKFLDFDHANNDGSLRRKKSTSSFVYLAHKHNVTGIQVLCANCNWRKHAERLHGSSPTTQHRRRLRLKTFEHYSGGDVKCACCGERDILVLTLDHKNGGGTAHRKRVGREWYRLLRNQGYPDGYQVLCRNCNHGKWRNGGECPHLSIA